MNQPPKRAWQISLNVGADSYEDAVALAEDLLSGIHPGSKVAHGGVSAGGSLDVSNNPEMTHEKYIAALDAYLEKEDSKPTEANGTGSGAEVETQKTS